ncbi:cytochrome c oxidase assembly protein subunit 17 [Sporothrix brasiliensis 5110]|uniref:Cytochrome c oxidase assembly protein subunit 17 n=1 Tax=Sporothrix brasiliensis 5110 TaxID=1398154 RepID=A0A0C2EQ51_9PEZI|nr:cytochrome c oxidase assembly protein subunit 17 [Sporothrix brasiliensis 5110]KIH88454.1 cytochrome c oxidase assembly protein subunit 17 [Sporothrix brasiliensis 5110]
MSSSQQKSSIAAESCPAPSIATSEAASKPKEKSKRDECMLFSNAANPSVDCKSTIDQYRTCMAGFGFKV